MKTVRRNTFETNSSSCHSVTICGIDKLKSYHEKQLACIHKVRFYKNGYNVTVVPDDDFISIKTLFQKVKEFAYENEKIVNKYYPRLLDMTYEKFQNTVYKDIDLYSFMNDYIFDSSLWLSGMAENDPFDGKENKQNCKIHSLPVVINTEVKC